MQKPGTVQAIAIMQLVGGIWAVLWPLSASFLFLMSVVAAPALICIAPVLIYSIVVGILCIVKGAQLLGDRSDARAPTATAIMQIVNILGCDVVSLILGILTLVFLGQSDVKAYFRPTA